MFANSCFLLFAALYDLHLAVLYPVNIYLQKEMNMQEIAVIALILMMVVIAILIVYWSWQNGISPMPSSLKAKRCLLSALPQPLHGKIYELGTGWGTLLFPLARQYPDCQVVGFETSPIPYLVSRIRQLYCRLPNVVLERRDFFSVLYGDADLIVCYLYPGAMRKLQIKFDRELKPGT